MLKNLLKLIPVVALIAMVVIPQDASAQSSAEQLIKAYKSGQLTHPTKQDKTIISEYIQAGMKKAPYFQKRVLSPNVVTFIDEDFSSTTPLLVDDFNFTGLLTDNGWTAHSGAGTNAIETTTGLTYTDYPGSGLGNAAQLDNTGEDVNKLFPSAITSGNIYFSALVNVTNAVAGYFLHLGTGTSSFAARVFVQPSATPDKINFGVSNSSTAVYGTTEFEDSTTYLIIVKYEVANPSNVSLWVVSSGIPYTEAAAGTPEITTTTGTGLTSIAGIYLRQYSSSQDITVDGIRAGSAWGQLFGTAPPAGWAQNTIATDPNFDLWHFDNPGARTINSPMSDPSAIFDSDWLGNDGNPEDVALESIPFDASASANVVVDWDEYFYASFGGGAHLDVFDGSVWVMDVYSSTTTSSNPDHQSVDISSYVAGVSNAQVRFRWTGDWSYYWILDNVQVYEPDPTPDPAVLVSPPDAGTNVNPLTSLEWTAGGGAAPTGYRINFGTDNPPTNIENNTDLGNVTTYTPSSALAYSTTYYWEIIPYTGAGDASGTEIWSFTTGDDPTVTIPYTENFDGVAAPNIPYGWTVENTNGDDYAWVTSSSYGRSAPNAMYIRWNSALAMDDWFFSPPVELTGGVSYDVSFWYYGSSTFPENLEVLYGSSPSSTGMEGGQIFNDAGFTLSSYTEGVATFTPTTTGTYFIGWHGYSDADQLSIKVDDVTIEETPAAGLFPPTNLQASVLGQDVNLTWMAPGADQYLRYDNGVNDNSIGLTAGGTFEASARFPSDIMAPFADAGKAITEVDIYILDVPSSCIIKIYDEGTPSAPGTLLYSEDVTSSIVGGSFNNITLTTPVSINGNDMWIGYEVTHAAGEHPAGCDAGPADPNGDWLFISPDWMHSGYGNWNIAGYVTTPGPKATEHTRIIARNTSNLQKTGNEIQRKYKEINLGRFSKVQSSEQVFSKSVNNPISRQLAGEQPTDGIRGIDATFIGYNVYRDATQIATDITNTFYDDPSVAYGFYSYKATSDYTEGESDPAGPVNVVVPPPPAALPFTEDWESGDFGDWLVVNGAQTNQWVVGTAAGPHGGSYSAYISDDGGTTNHYDSSASSVVHIFRDITFSGSLGGGYALTFWWKGQGESSFDYLRVYVVDQSIVPEEGVQLSSGQVGETYYNQQGTDTMATIILPDALTGTTKRLVFSWRNDGSVGTQPPVSLDDISIEAAQTGVLNGTVTDCSSADPLEGADVTAGTYTTTTNSSGFYEFPTLPFGTYDVTVSRLGYADSTVTGVEVTIGNTTTEDFCLNATLIPPQNLAASVSDQDVQLTWDAPPNNVLRWDGGNAGNAIGVGGGTFEVSARFDHSLMNSLTGKELQQVEIFINDPPDNVTLKIYDQGTPTSPGTLLYSEDVTSSIVDYSYNLFTLTTPITLSGNDIWIGYEVTHTGSTYPAGCDGGPMVYPDGQWTYLAPGPWAPLSDLAPTLTYNWNIAGLVYNAGPFANNKPVVINSNSAADKNTKSFDAQRDNRSMNSANSKLQSVRIDNKISQKVGRSEYLKHFGGDGINATLTGYNVYRDGASIATGVTDLFYNDNGLAYDTYSYTVSAQYTEGESEPTGPVVVNVVNPNTDTMYVYPMSAAFWTGATEGTVKTDGEINTVYPNLGWAVFDISGIPSGATINAINFTGHVDSTNYPYWSGTPMGTVNPVTDDAASIFNQVDSTTGSGVAYIYSNEGAAFDTGYHTYPMMNTATSDLQASLSQGWFAMGFEDRDGLASYYVNFSGWSSNTPPYLEVIYTTGGTTTFPLDVDVAAGWNMVSVPGNNPDGMNVSDWWADLTGTVYKFVPGSGYQGTTTTTPGEGYWLKNSATETYSYPSIEMVANDPINASTGWNMFGGYENSVDPAALTTTPTGQIIYPIYKFTPGSGYSAATSIDPGYGYWVKVSTDCQINVPGAAAKGNMKIADMIKDDWGRISISDASGHSYTLYAVKGEVDLNNYELPPLPPAGIFDVRYSSGRLAENINSDFQSIDLRGVNYPVKVKADKMDIRLQDATGKLVNTNIKSGEEITISNTAINKLMVSGQLIPDQYSLEQNYPNPFNPTTTIEFSLPENVKNVRISIYNVLGEKIAELVNGEMVAGKYQYQWDAKNYASGMYIYELRTDKFVSIKKMMLLK